jgi:hypothetical protein
MTEVLCKIRARQSGKDAVWKSAPAEGQNGGSCGSSELAIAVPRRSWRGMFLRDGEISWDRGDVAPVPRSPVSWGDRRKIQATASVPKKNCLTEGVHPKGLCPILCPPSNWKPSQTVAKKG